MTSLKKKLTLLLITLFAAICLGVGVFMLPSASSSAAEEVTLSSSDNFEISGGGVFTGLSSTGMTAVNGKKFKIDLPSAVTEIATGYDSASTSQNALFGRNASNLVEVTFKSPEKLTKIGSLAFNGCSSLESIDLSTTVNLATVEQGAFKGCSKLVYMTLPTGVTTVAKELFSGCTTLRGVTIGNNNIKEIGEKAFENCFNLTSVSIPDNLKTIGASAFYGCRNLEELVLPDSAVDIGASAFAYCISLETVRLSDDIESIEDYTFTNCTSLTRIYTDKEDTTSVFKLPSKIDHIGIEAFNSCISITKIVIPSTVTTINDRAFYGCRAVTDIYFNAAQVSLSTGATQTFGVAEAITDVTLHIGDTNNAVTQLPPNLFSGHKGLVKIDFNNVKLTAGVAAWGTSTFSDCSSLKEITFASGCEIPVINESAFANCVNLTDINGLENTGLGTIEKQAFFNCRSLRTFTIGSNVSEINTEAFLNCRKLVEVQNLSEKPKLSGLTAGSNDCGLVAYYALRVYKTGGSKIDENNANHPDYVFYADLEQGGAGVWLMDYVGTATEIDLPNNYNGGGSYNILRDAFVGKSDITEIIIPDIAQVKVIGDSAFANCTSLSHIKFPYTLLTAGDNMLQGCSALTNVDFGVHPTTPNVGINIINSYMFKDCVSLKTITLPRNITTIENNAFEGCESLTSVTFGAGLTGTNKVELLRTIEGEAFKGCTSLALIELPSTVTSIGQSAFDGCTNLSFVYLPANATYGSNVFGARGGDSGLMLISTDRVSYTADKTKLSVYENNLTFVVIVELIYQDSAVPSGVHRLSRLYNRYAGYNSASGKGIWNSSGSMPVPRVIDGTSFYEFIWYKTDAYNLADKVDIDEFTKLLANTALVTDNNTKITLYGNYIGKPSLSANDRPITYDAKKSYTMEQIFTEILAEKIDTEPGFATIDTTKFNEYKSKFRFNIVSHTLVNEEKESGFKWDPNEPIVDAGTYELAIELNPDYGTWSTPYTISFKINPKIQDISKAVEWTTKSGKLDPDNPFKTVSGVPTESQVNAAAQVLYFYDNGTTPYTQLPTNGEEYTMKYVLSSCAAYNDGKEIEILLGWIGTEYGTVVAGSYTNNVGTEADTYTTTVVIRPNNNYLLTFTSDALTRALGLDFSRAADGAVTVSKTWYIFVDSNNRLVSGDGGNYDFRVRDQEDKVIDWVYGNYWNDNSTTARLPSAPEVLYGATASLVSFSLQYNGTVVTKKSDNNGFIQLNNSNWVAYINSTLPAGDYVLTFKIKEYTDGTNTYGSDEYVYEFTVKPARVGNSDRNIVTNTLNGTKSIGYTGDVVFLDTSTLSLFSKKIGKVHPNSGVGIGYWSDFKEYYTHFEISYYVSEAGKDYPDKNYYTAQQFKDDYATGNRVRSYPVNIGTYTIYYKVSAPSWCFEFPAGSQNYVSELTGSYTLHITHTLKKFAVGEIDYTGVSVLPDIDAILRRGNSEIFDDYSFIDVFTLTEASKGATPDNFFTKYGKPDGDTYTEVGWHVVFLSIKDIYKDYILWDKSISSSDYDWGFIKGTNRQFLVVQFEITSEGDMETPDGKLSVSTWEYGMFTREANAPHWKLTFNTDELTYQFQLIAVDGGNTYFFNNDPNAPLDGMSFKFAPAGMYRLKAISPENAEKGWGRFEREIDVEVKEASLVFEEVPYIDSWNYGNLPKNIGLPDLNTALGGLGNQVASKVKIYYCLRVDYDKVDGVPTLYDSLEKMQNSEGQVPAGEYYVIYRLNKDDLDPADKVNFANWEYKVRFRVLSAANSWKSLYVPDFDYVDYDSAIARVEVIPNFGDASRVFIQYRRKGTDSAFRSLDQLLNIEGKLDIGSYEMRAILAATENFARLESVTSFTVSRAANKWVDVPSIRGWAEGNYSAEKNGIIAKAALGNVELTITDESGKEYSTHDLSSLGIGTYKLTAKVAGTNNYDELVSEIYFDVIEDSVGLTGLIASTVVFSVVALGLAGAAITLLVLRNKKAEREFRKAVRNELRRK